MSSHGFTESHSLWVKSMENTNPLNNSCTSNCAVGVDSSSEILNAFIFGAGKSKSPPPPNGSSPYVSASIALYLVLLLLKI